MTLEEIKEKYAKDQEFKNWKDLSNELIFEYTEETLDELMKRSWNAALDEFYKQVYMNDEIVENTLPITLSRIRLIKMKLKK